ncbi:MAG: SIS domain-containing protein [Solobacterium sp.]|nr:SIS domain-containing protein [Solobacterium sp.]
MIDEIVSKKEVKTLSFAGCGGSLACFYAPFYYMTHESSLNSTYTTSNEFVHDTPKSVNEHAVVVVASRRGNTAETVEAAKVAKAKGATVIGLQYEKDTPLEKVVDYAIQFDDADGIPVTEGKSMYALQIAYELTNAIDHNTDTYKKMVAAAQKMNDLIPSAKKSIVPEAIKFSIDYQNDNVIYTMGSGTAWSAAQQQQICIFMEMQWINSSVIHTGEFFHGPFEITDPDTAFLLLKSTGKTRDLDDRALTFLNKYNHHLFVIDGEDYGMKDLGDVSEYYDYEFNTQMLGVFNHLLADMRNHPLSKRKYMWKYNY